MASIVYRLPTKVPIVSKLNSTSKKKMFEFANITTNILKPKKQNLFARIRYKFKSRKFFFLWKIYLKKQKSQQIDFLKRFEQRNLRKGFNAFLYRYQQWQLLKRVVTRPDKKQAWGIWMDFVLSKQEGDKYQLEIASRFWKKRNLRSLFVQWQAGVYYFAREREMEMNGMAIRYWQKRETYQLFRRWCSFLKRRKRTRYLINKLFNGVLRKQLKFGYNRWASFSRRVALYHKRALREAVHFWNNRYVTLLFQNWKLHVKEVVATRLKLLSHMKNKDISTAFKAWHTFCINAKNRKNRLRHLIQMAIGRWKRKKLVIGFYHWQKLCLVPKELQPVELPEDLERLFATAKEDVVSYQKKTMKLTDEYYKRTTSGGNMNNKNKNSGAMNSNTPGKKNVDVPIYDKNLDDVEFLKLLEKIANADYDDDDDYNSLNEDEGGGNSEDDDYYIELFTKTKKKKIKKLAGHEWKFRYSGVGNTSSIDLESL